ncbi:uncharacterized protein LOC113519051 [Galleria mellonella]|uniref:Uncharacterized protein LOC113519051 n=1 Tax=Galleria mellonella TaxID=7137 RepID=A0A6J3BT49_GALME|nr:uncharacterized protein LOC113519051 [Galleria mellonella]
MFVRIKYAIGFIYLITLNVKANFLDVQSSPQDYSPEIVRVKRQDGTREQQMYYAYPVPSSGDTVNIGYSSSTAASTAATGGSASGASGYNYGSQSSGASGSQASSGGTSSGYNYGTQNAATSGSQASSGAGPSGYNYNVPTSTAPNIVASDSVSTNAPKYLPPVAGGNAQVDVSLSANVPSVGGTPEPIKPLSPTTLQFSSPGPVQVPETNYLPPKPAPPSEPLPAPTPAQSPAPIAVPAPSPTTGYLPPSGYGTVSTPAATYLPPVL